MTISLTDRQLIDAAIAAGRVRNIPRGVSGLDPTKGRDWRIIGLAILENNRRAVRLSGSLKPEIVKVERAATKEGVDEQIRSMRLAGMSYDAISASLGFAKSHVWRRCRKMGIA